MKEGQVGTKVSTLDHERNSQGGLKMSFILRALALALEHPPFFINHCGSQYRFQYPLWPIRSHQDRDQMLSPHR